MMDRVCFVFCASMLVVMRTKTVAGETNNILMNKETMGPLSEQPEFEAQPYAGPGSSVGITYSSRILRDSSARKLLRILSLSHTFNKLGKSKAPESKQNPPLEPEKVSKPARLAIPSSPRPTKPPVPSPPSLPPAQPPEESPTLDKQKPSPPSAPPVEAKPPSLSTPSHSPPPINSSPSSSAASQLGGEIPSGQKSSPINAELFAAVGASRPTKKFGWHRVPKPAALVKVSQPQRVGSIASPLTSLTSVAPIDSSTTPQSLVPPSNSTTSDTPAPTTQKPLTSGGLPQKLSTTGAPSSPAHPLPIKPTNSPTLAAAVEPSKHSNNAAAKPPSKSRLFPWRTSRLPRSTSGTTGMENLSNPTKTMSDLETKPASEAPLLQGTWTASDMQPTSASTESVELLDSPTSLGPSESQPQTDDKPPPNTLPKPSSKGALFHWRTSKAAALTPESTSYKLSESVPLKSESNTVGVPSATSNMGTWSPEYSETSPSQQFKGFSLTNLISWKTAMESQTSSNNKGSSTISGLVIKPDAPSASSASTTNTLLTSPPSASTSVEASILAKLPESKLSTTPETLKPLANSRPSNMFSWRYSKQIKGQLSSANASLPPLNTFSSSSSTFPSSSSGTPTSSTSPPLAGLPPPGPLTSTSNQGTKSGRLQSKVDFDALYDSILNGISFMGKNSDRWSTKRRSLPDGPRDLSLGGPRTEDKKREEGFLEDKESAEKLHDNTPDYSSMKRSGPVGDGASSSRVQGSGSIEGKKSDTENGEQKRIIIDDAS